MNAASTSTIRVVLADDHQAIRRTLRTLLEDEADLEVVAEAEDQLSAMQQVTRQQPDVLALDLQMQGGSGLNMIRRLRALAPATEIVVVSMHDDRVFARHALQAGACAYVLKDRAAGELPDAIRGAAQVGRDHCAPAVSP